jgi:hypothetical protein
MKTEKDYSPGHQQPIAVQIPAVKPIHIVLDTIFVALILVADPII